MYPFNRAAVKLAMDKKGNNPCSSVAFIPFCSPSTNRQTDVQANVTKFDFTEIELQCFQCRYEEGYNILGDTRYEKWLSALHPESWDDDSLLVRCDPYLVHHIPQPA